MEMLKVGELKSKFSHILQRVQAGEEIIISFILEDLSKTSSMVPCS